MKVSYQTRKKRVFAQLSKCSGRAHLEAVLLLVRHGPTILTGPFAVLGSDGILQTNTEKNKEIILAV